MDRSSIDKFNWRWFMDLLNFKRNRPLLMNWQIRVSFKGGTQSSNSSYESIYWSIDSGSSGFFLLPKCSFVRFTEKLMLSNMTGAEKLYFVKNILKSRWRERRRWRGVDFKSCWLGVSVREARFKLVHNTSSARSSTYFHLLCVR